jgi:hypothetical protein
MKARRDARSACAQIRRQTGKHLELRCGRLSAQAQLRGRRPRACKQKRLGLGGREPGKTRAVAVDRGKAAVASGSA